MGTSVVKSWVSDIGLRHQGVLLTAVRGCDTVAKDDPVKTLARAYRERILNCHCRDSRKSASFIERLTDVRLIDVMNSVIGSHDHLPHHYIMHLIHASEIIGYKDREDSQFAMWLDFYLRMCRKLHMTAETEDELDVRLNADEVNFGAAQ